MKAIIISIGVIILLFAIVITNAIYINLLLSSIEDGLKITEAVHGYEELYTVFLRHEWLLSLTMDDERLLEIKLGLVDCLGYSQAQRYEELDMEKSRLLSMLGQLKRLSRFDIMAIM